MILTPLAKRNRGIELKKKIYRQGLFCACQIEKKKREDAAKVRKAT